MKIFYQHALSAFGDCMPFWWDGTYYLYHQRDYDLERPLTVPFGWSLATTRDFVEYKDHGDAIPKGETDAQDQFIYAGSVYLGADGLPHAFYTGYNDHFATLGKPAQVLMRAVSGDGLYWEKEGQFELPPAPGYDPDDWRDPVVLRDDQQDRWILIVGTRLAGPKVQRTGRVVWFSSSDADQWHFEGDLYAPNKYAMQEMPDLFEMNGRWYLLWTEYSDRSKTEYATGLGPEGPWNSPRDDAFDGRAYYAARTASDGARRFLFGWVANKAAATDAGPFVWAGTLVVHEVLPREDGTLGVGAPRELLDAVMSNRKEIQSVDLRVASGRAVQLLGRATESSYGFEATIHVEPGTRSFSLLFGGDPGLDDWYAYTVDLFQRRLFFDRSPSFPWNRYESTGLERPLPDEIIEGDLRLRLIVDESLAVLYLNDIALSARVYEPAGSAVGVDVVDGAVHVTEAAISAVPLPLSAEY